MSASGRVVITGAPRIPGENAAPNRLNIVQFVQDEMMFSLYIQALEELYDKGQEDPLSFFQLAGIHGAPYVPWNDDPIQEPAGTFGGYCVHATTLFPTWHRPYVAAFEQALHSRAVEIAKTYTTDPVEWLNAAAALRQPFWDWAAPGEAVPPPEVFLSAQVVITTPDGKRTAVDNPLLKYRFESVPDDFPSRFKDWKTTLRYPKNGESNPDKFDSQLSKNQEQLTQRVFYMFSELKKWPQFSNSRAPGSDEEEGPPASSLEDIHNTMHTLSGGAGHMGSVPVAAFDPIFWLHHTNVDRLLSLWAAINPGVWVTQDSQPDGTWSIPDNALIDNNTNLTPFLASQDLYWTSHRTSGTVFLGYSYPDFDGLDMINRNEVRTRIQEVIQALYGIYNPFSTGSSTQPEAPATQATTLARNPIWDWSVRVRVQPMELKDSFSVLIFVGPVPENPDEWDDAPSYVGSFDAFVNSASERCANCQRQANVVTQGYVHIGRALLRHLGPVPFESATVDPYLKTHIDWRVRMLDETVVPVENLHSLEVVVIAQQLGTREGEVLPVPVGAPVPHPNITRGRVGGAPPE